MLKASARVVSIIMHPLFIIGYVLLFLIVSNPYLFGFGDDKAKGLTIISVISIAVVFPLIAIAMMRMLRMISSFEMPDKQERIGPLIVTGIFYLWLYINIRNNDHIPTVLSAFVLGSTISVFLALFINSFSKISLHTIAAGGLTTGMIFIIFNSSFGYTDLTFPFSDWVIRLSDRIIVAIIVIIAGTVGTARLYLKSHIPQEIYMGYLAGILAQLLAFKLYF